MENSAATESALLVEYTLAHNEVDRLNRQLWTTGQILIPLSITGLGILATIKTHNVASFTAIILIGLLSCLILSGWYRIGCRWFGYQSIAQYRMIEIERELGLWCTRYELHSSASSTTNRTLTEEERKTLTKIPDNIVPKGRSSRLLMRDFVLIITISWLFLSIREYLLVWC